MHSVTSPLESNVRGHEGHNCEVVIWITLAQPPSKHLSLILTIKNTITATAVSITTTISVATIYPQPS
jgi:hypothetical protein